MSRSIFGFTAAHNLDVELVREVSWSNVRDKLNLGLFDARICWHRSRSPPSLGIGHVRVPIVAPSNLGLNGNAITVSPRLFSDVGAVGRWRFADRKYRPFALARLVAERKARNAEPLTFA